MLIVVRKALPVHHTETTSGEWDGPANEARLRNDENENYYSRAYAWQDPEGDPSTKAAYKFIHHEVDGDGNVGAANVTACRAGIAVLNGARGGTTIPDEDRQGVYDHLAAHLTDAGEDPPELQDRSLSQARRQEVQHRTFPLTEVRLIKRADGEPPVLKGHAAVFNQLSEELWFGIREKIRPGAFTKTISEADVRALWNHNPDYVLGRNKAGTLRLEEDDVGLAVEIDPPDTTWARDLMTTIERGDVNQMSFGFLPIREEKIDNPENDVTIYEVIEARLFDVSPVTFPAYPQTDIAVRSLLVQNGVNYDALTQTIVRRQRGDDLTNGDREAIEAAIEALRACLPAAPGQGSHPAGEPEPTSQGRNELEVLSRQLEIMRLEAL